MVVHDTGPLRETVKMAPGQTWLKHGQGKFWRRLPIWALILLLFQIGGLLNMCQKT